MSYEAATQIAAALAIGLGSLGSWYRNRFAGCQSHGSRG